MMPDSPKQVALWKSGDEGAAALRMEAAIDSPPGPDLHIPAGRTRLLREAQVTFRETGSRDLPDPGTIHNSREAFEVVKGMASWDREVIISLFLSSRNTVLGYEVTGVGGINRCGIQMNGVLRTALTVGAAALILAHNHPSGDPTPSPEDWMVTRQARDAAVLIGLSLLDHMVIGQGRYFSFADQSDVLKAGRKRRTRNGTTRNRIAQQSC